MVELTAPLRFKGWLWRWHYALRDVVARALVVFADFHVFGVGVNANARAQIRVAFDGSAVQLRLRLQKVDVLRQ